MMRILYIYRNNDSGHSMRRVFQPIQNEVSLRFITDSIYLPESRLSFISLYKNIRFVLNYLKENKYDVIHLTGDLNYLLYFLKRYNVVTTVHDIGTVSSCRWGIKKLMLFLYIVFPIKFANKVVFISKTTQKEVLYYIKLDPSQGSVIYDPVSNDFNYTPNTFNKDCPTILHVGEVYRKNLEGTIKALTGVKCKLHIIAHIPESFIKLLDDSKIQYVNEFNVSDDRIVEAYKLCDIVSFPSFYEGFGVPIIEAQATGRPILTSDIPPLNEIAQKSAALVDPYSIESIKNGFFDIFQNYDKFVSLGLKNVEKFRLSTISHEYMALYESMVVRNKNDKSIQV